MSKLIGIFGGTFDPIHVGHLNAVELVAQQIDFDQVNWVLSARPPHKDKTSVSIESRYEMLSLALQDHHIFKPDRSEINRKEKSYTIDTIEKFHKDINDAQLFLIIGADSFLSFTTWFRYKDIIDNVNLIVMNRPGYSCNIPDFFKDKMVDEVNYLIDYPAGKCALFEQPKFNISSTQIRELFSNKVESARQISSLKKYIPTRVLEYIINNQLYKNEYHET